MDNQYVEFTPPKGFVPPEGDGPFDLVCTFERRPNGMICMTKLGDVDMPKKGEKEGEESKPSYGEYAQGMMNEMGQGAGGGGGGEMMA